MNKTDGKIQTFLGDEAGLEKILFASDKEILEMAITEYVNPVEETEKLMIRLSRLVESYSRTEREKVTPADDFLGGSIKMIIAVLEKVQATQSESINRVFADMAQINRQIETQLLHVSKSFSERLEYVHANLHSQIVELIQHTNATENLLASDNSSVMQAQTLSKHVNDAQSQVLIMNRSIEEMQRRADCLRVSLKLQAEELMSSLHVIFEHLAATGDVMNDAVDDVLQKQASRQLRKIG